MPEDDMSAIQRVGDLEVAQDLEFQQRMWVVQRAGWIVMLLVVAVAAIGFLGHGPLSGASTGTAAGGAEVDYGRFVRHRASAEIAVTIPPDQVQSEQVTVSISQQYASGVDIEEVLPEPSSVIVDSYWLTYVFDVGDVSEPFQVSFDIMPIKTGWREAEVRVGTGDPISFGQFVYP
jgi:hypothetical protein